MEIKLRYTPEEICNIYSQALEWETGIPVNNLSQMMTFDSYELCWDDLNEICLITIKGVYIPFELDGENITVINEGNVWELVH